MKAFNVLDRQQNIYKNYLLEASAGTGKTFAIENMVVRLLLDQQFEMDQILVVTFTRAATRDLTIRIRANIEKALRCLRCGEISQAPDYLKEYLEKDDEAVFYARRKLEKALFSFDQAQIFTIHGFCSRMLREFIFDGDLAIGATNDEVTGTETHMVRSIRDYFRTEMDENSYSKTQLNILLKAYENSVTRLETDLLHVLKKGLEIEELPNYQEQLRLFQQCMSKINAKDYDPKKIEEDFFQQAPFYKIHNKNREIKEEYLIKLSRFSSLFGKSDWNANDFDILQEDGILLLEVFSKENLNQKGKKNLAVTLHYPDFISLLKEKLFPIVTLSRSSTATFSRIASGCQKLWQRSLHMEEIINYDSLLKCMWKAVRNPIFSEKVRSLYKAAIIDEFQDTDPIQWQIFNTLFLEGRLFQGILYLVGDPKQSIYSFRQADIYTYFFASDAIGKANHASLNTNFRSHPPLIQALNTLFSSETTPCFMPLPKLGASIEYPDVKPAEIPEKSFCDTFGSVHFCLASNESSNNLEKIEEALFLPFYVQEILRLQEKDGIPFNSHAILVADRYQAERVSKFLESNGILTHCQRNLSLVNGPAFRSLYEILDAVIHSHNQNAIKKALGGTLIGFTCHEILKISESNFEKVISFFFCLRKSLFQEGFAAFFNTLLHIRWYDSETILERLLTYDHGLNFYEELMQLFQIVLEYEEKENASPEGLLYFLDTIEDSEENKESLKKRTQTEKKAVNILTLHASKGLEFDIVFAIGLVKRNNISDPLIPTTCADRIKLSPHIDPNSLEFKNYCLELDAEKMRQLYVAMTRAKFRLYLPVLVGSETGSPYPGCASPMELFLAKLGQPSADVEELYTRMAGYDGKILSHFIEQLPNAIKMTYCFLEKQNSSHKEASLKVAEELYIPPIVHIPGTEEYIVSFTSLTSKNHLTVFNEKALSQVESHDKTIHTIPAGAEIGILLHKILEKINFQDVHSKKTPSEMIDQIRPYLKNTSFENWETTVSEMIFNAMKVPFSFHDKTFSLSEIPNSLIHKEIEFLYLKDSSLDFSQNKEFLKGVIDLIFFHDGHYFIVDWKSNWLGPTTHCYTLNDLEEAMASNQYFLQEEIYANALKKYLSVFDKRPFQEIFGGCFYVFLRGLSLNDPNTGIFYIPPKNALCYTQQA